MSNIEKILVIWMLFFSSVIVSSELKPCPDSPNCVSSRATDSSHRVEPLSYSEAQGVAEERLLATLARLPRYEMVKSGGGYFHFTQKSLIFRFIDDVEFLFDDQRKVIDIRSSSRTGYSDLGVNRRRIEEIRRLFNQGG